MFGSNLVLGARRSVLVLVIFTILFAPLAAAKDLNLTIVYDNNSYKEGLETRWGFSCFVEGPEKTIMFDVGGEGSVLLRNMEKLSLDPKSVDVVVLSHIHNDHIGGLPDFLKRNSNVTVYMPESLPGSVKNTVKKAGARLVEVDKSIEICKDVYSTGELGSWIKEESLVIKTAKGAVVITGCAHPGVVKIVKKAKETAKSDAYLVLGGFHLCWVNARKIKGIVKGLKEEEVKKAAPCHCSGDLARKLFEETYKDSFILTGVGKRIKVENAFPDTKESGVKVGVGYRGKKATVLAQVKKEMEEKGSKSR